MEQIISIGKQDYEEIIKENYFYIDKTDLIRVWWESGDDVTLITRPRRFGKTLNMSMLKCFFSNQYAGKSYLFKKHSIWKEKKYQKLQGTFPVIYLSFADVKADNYEECRNGIIAIINELYQSHRYLLQGDIMTDGEKELFRVLDNYSNNPSPDKKITNEIVARSIKTLSSCLMRYYGKKVIILLDEYDTPMQEAYVYGFWEELTTFIRALFNSTFKTNPYMERAMLTGITGVSKESIFSDLNNLNVITAVSEKYASYFGFTEEEVFYALEKFGLGNQKEEVKNWYDGFSFGRLKDIYNPWSITNYLDKKRFDTYWASTSSNGLISKLLKISASDIKEKMEILLSGEEIIVNFDEQIVFEQLEQNANAIWSLMVASGYLKIEQIEYRGTLRTPWYHLKITNLETMSMFSSMFQNWFTVSSNSYNGFIEALLSGNKKEMNAYMNEVALATFSSFDVGRHPSGRTEPERFYHGFVLGLLVQLRDHYVVKSNRESGYGRYDVLLLPLIKRIVP
ncbi:AAA family ATPase [Blautia sp. MSJ-19]|uniref:AAA family ATPase n=1 Tax=Blautia sp. MSJ-19 TaxID=2841517 RepID=UPI002ED5E8AE